MSLSDVSQLLWAAQGVTAGDGLRTAPSAGALYPLEVHLVVGHVPELAKGVYRYQPLGHRITLVVEGDWRSRLAGAALEQYWLAEASVMLVLTAVYERTTTKYRGRGKMYVHIEVGHVVQSVCLQAVALGLGSVVVGAFEEAKVGKIIGLPRREVPLALMAVGRAK